MELEVQKKNGLKGMAKGEEVNPPSFVNINNCF